MTLTNEDLDAIRKIVDDRAVQTEKLISMSVAQLRVLLTGPHPNLRPNNPWDLNVLGWSVPNPIMSAAVNGNDNSFGIAFIKLMSVEKLDESEFSKDLIDEFNKSFGSVIKLTDLIKLSVAERSDIMTSKILPIITRKAKEFIDHI